VTARTVQLRRAGPEDARAIAEVHVRSWKAAFPGLLPQHYLDTLRPEDRLGQWEEALSTSAWPVVLVAEDERAIVGFVALSPSRDADADPSAVGEIQTIYLDPPAFGGGTGSALLQAAEAELARAGFTSATLWVLETNAKARRFYERHGWTTDGGAQEHDWVAFTAPDVRYRRALELGPLRDDEVRQLGEAGERRRPQPE
jgi:ribosomal protein S18 acetylase RimI-like enzyme